jgi:uncharacterized surface protein with fasciclin (FAS1) repeats
MGGQQAPAPFTATRKSPAGFDTRGSPRIFPPRARQTEVAARRQKPENKNDHEKQNQPTWLAGRALLALLAAFFLASIPAQATHWSGNLVQRLERDGRFTTLLTALEIAGLKGTVATGGTFTVFAPTDEAFAALPPGTVESLVTNVPALQNILLYHAVSGRQSAAQLLHNSTTTTLQGNPVLVVRGGSKVFVNGQEVALPSLPASNGIIHPIKGVLLPPASPITLNSLVDVLALDGRFTTLLAAVQAAGLADVLANGGPFTLFAPTDAAFAALPPGTVESLVTNVPALQNILLYHVLGRSQTAAQLAIARRAETLQGADVTISYSRLGLAVNQARVLNTNVKAPNGVIHVIDAVLLPPPPKTNLLEVLKNDGRFDTLVAALGAAGLDGVVAGGGPFTLFAPTDDAFAALPPGAVAGLLADTNALKNVLLYHVVGGSKSAPELLRLRTVPTLQGSSVKVYSWWKKVFVNRAEVLEADLCASNGTIHALKAVLLPPAGGGHHHDDDDESDD